MWTWKIQMLCRKRARMTLACQSMTSMALVARHDSTKRDIQCTVKFAFALHFAEVSRVFLCALILQLYTTLSISTSSLSTTANKILRSRLLKCHCKTSVNSCNGLTSSKGALKHCTYFQYTAKHWWGLPQLNIFCRTVILGPHHRKGATHFLVPRQLLMMLEKIVFCETITTQHRPSLPHSLGWCGRYRSKRTPGV